MAKEEKQYFIFIRSTGEKVPVSKEQHDAFYRKPTASVTRNRITAGACVHTVMHGNAMVTASAANTTQQGTPFLLTLQIRTVTAICTTICRIATPQSRNSFLTAYYWSSFLHACANLIRKRIPLFNSGWIIRKVSLTVLLQGNSVARRKPSRIK